MQFSRSQVTIRFAELIRGFSKRNENDAPPPVFSCGQTVKQLECFDSRGVMDDAKALWKIDSYLWTRIWNRWNAVQDDTENQI